MKDLVERKQIIALIVFIALLSSNLIGGMPIKRTFPRIAGMNIGAKNYNDSIYRHALSRYDLVVLGFYRGWKQGGQTPKSVVLDLKVRNPNILVGQYTLMNEAYDDTLQYASEKDIYDALYENNWWLKDSAGRKIQRTSVYSAWEVNFTEFAPPDKEGRRYPQWRAERDFRLYFDAAPFDIWYFDNVMKKPRVKGDYEVHGHNDDPTNPSTVAAFRRGMAAEWQRAQELKPGLVRIGNTDGDLSQPEYINKLNGAFLESQMGKSSSYETWVGWHGMMENYHNVIKNTLSPKLVILNIQSDKSNYQMMRYGLSSTLMDDGYYCFTDTTTTYSSVAWFDEFNIDLGAAIDPPQVHPWQKGVYRRNFEYGLVLVNPKGNGIQTIDVGSGFQRIKGTQDTVVNNGTLVKNSLTIPESDGIILMNVPSSRKK